MSRKIVFRGILVIVIIGALVRFFLGQPDSVLTHVTGQTMGTIVYNVKYMGNDVPDYKRQIDSVLKAFNQSLSTYIPDSEISILNDKGKLVTPSQMFLDVTRVSSEIYALTDGAFDPTVGPLVNVWGFGPDKKINVPDSSMIDSLMRNVGFERIAFSENKVEMDQSMYLDYSAVAKGYAVDLVANFLEGKGLENYMVEIGGEVRARGQNDQSEVWKIGIEDPLVTLDQRKLLAIVRLKDMAMATSGNYRNFYTVGNRTVAHTIDPRTGFNTHHNLLSASVFAPDCMSADAYATAFMVLGLKDSKDILEATDLEAFLIYQEDDRLKSYVSPGLESLIDLNKIQ